MNTVNTSRSTGVVTRLLAVGLTVLLLALALFSFSTGSSQASVLKHKPTPTPSPTLTPSPSPSPGPWALTGSMHSIRAGHTATLLPNGQVLVAGGYTDFYAAAALASAELYTPATGKWTATGSMNIARIDATATLLNDSQVLVAGGADATITPGTSSSPLASAELFNPATGAWTTTGSMNTSRLNQTATLLNNGQVLVAGGVDTSDLPIASAELFTP